MSDASGRSHVELGGLRVLSLCSFAVAQPLYDVLGHHAQFFVSRGSSAVDVALFVLAVSFGVPALATLALALAKRLSGRVHLLLVLALVGGLCAVIALPVLNRAGASASLAFAASGAFGIACAAAYFRWPGVRSFATALSPAALLFPAIFVFGTPVLKLVSPGGPGEQGALTAAGESTQTPVIVVVFDLFPTTALMNEQREIDAERYPAFADLARSSHWFRYATSVAANTVLSVPAILTGTNPREDALALAVDYPANLFTWLAPTHDLHVFESETRLCPSHLCEGTGGPELSERLRSMALDTGVVWLHVLLPEDARKGLAPINAQWHGFIAPPQPRQDKREERHGLILEGRADRRGSGRLQKFMRFASGFDSVASPVFAYLHLSLPHAPFRFLPSGQTYVPRKQRLASMRRLLGIETNHAGQRSWGDEEDRIRLGYQRLTLQIGFVDHLLGSLLARLRSLGLFDRSLLVVMADHGMSFMPGQRTRSEVDGSTLFVPLFVKLPRQREGSIDDRNAETVDLAPTVADVLGSELPWPVDGRSLLRPDDQPRPLKRVILSRSRRRARGARSVQHTNWKSMLEHSLAQKLGFVGSGRMSEIYPTGPYGELVGHTLEALREGVPIRGRFFRLDGGDAGRVRVDQRHYLSQVDPQGPFVPAYLTGRLRQPGGIALATDLVVAMNGVVRATTRTEPETQRASDFGVLLPASAFVPGRNRIEFFVVSAVASDQVRLRPTRTSN